MVKLTGPGTAEKASGTLAGTLVFSHTKRGAYLKRHRKPKQPNTQPQFAMKAMLKGLSPAWHLASAYNQATWNPLATQREITPFNAYLGYNLARWRRKLPPTRAFPELGTIVTRTWGQPTLQTIGRYVEITWNLTALVNGWFIPIYRTLDGFADGTWYQLIGQVYQTAPGVGTFNDLHPLTGTNYYAVSLESNSGYEVPTPWHITHVFP